MKKLTLGFSLALVLALMVTSIALAEAVTKTGTVDFIDELGGTFTMTTAEAEVFVVTPPLGFDWTTLAVGDIVEVSGESDGAGNIAATGVTELTTVTGVIQSIDPLTCSFTILTPEGTTLTVLMPEGSDCSALFVGDTVEVTGTLNADGTFSASSVVVVPGEDDGGDEGDNTGFYCSNPEVPHPGLNKVATAHEADYATALDWFCGGGLGVGGVNMVLKLSEAFGKTTEEILTMRETMGWGQIKKALAAAAETPDETETLSTQGNGNSNGNGNGGGNGHGGGKPPWAGGGDNGRGPKNK
jgi:hypothetical protein